MNIEISILFPFLVLAVWTAMLGKNIKSNTMVTLFVIAVGYYLYDEFYAVTLYEGFRDSFGGMILLSLASFALSLLQKNKKYYWFATIAIFLLTLYSNGAFDKKKKQAVQLNSTAELFFAVDDNVSETEIKNKLAQLNLSPQKFDISVKNPNSTLIDNLWFVDTKNEADVQSIYHKIDNIAFVKWVEYNEIVQVNNFQLNDPLSSKQWTSSSFQLNEIAAVLNNINPAKKARLAIVDTGVDSKHEDLTNVIAKSGTDKNGHGTHCAGIAAAESNNNLGISSFNVDGKFIEIIPIQVLSPNGRGDQLKILEGIVTAADLGADVINMSFGGFSFDDKQKAYVDAINYARNKGAILVAAAGNSNRQAIHYSPANIEGVITVASIDNDMIKSHFSNTTEGLRMPIAAPGSEILSTFLNGKYQTLSGTSMAAPYVAGIIAVIKSVRPELTEQEIYSLLEKTGTKHNDSKKIGNIISPLNLFSEILD